MLFNIQSFLLISKLIITSLLLQFLAFILFFLAFGSHSSLLLINFVEASLPSHVSALRPLSDWLDSVHLLDILVRPIIDQNRFFLFQVAFLKLLFHLRLSEVFLLSHPILLRVSVILQVHDWLQIGDTALGSSLLLLGGALLLLTTFLSVLLKVILSR